MVLNLPAMNSLPRVGRRGAAGERVLRFAVPPAGTMRVSAELRRAWEAGAVPQARFEVIIETH